MGLDKKLTINVESFSASLKPDVELEQDKPPEYYDMLDSVKKGQTWTGPASAVIGVHFSPKVLNEVKPSDGELYLFPQTPTVSQQKDIVRTAATASGWNKRKMESVSSIPPIMGVFSIKPSDETSSTTVTVSPNAEYSGLLGIKVVPEKSGATWKVTKKKFVDIDL